MKVLELYSGIGGMHYATKECDIEGLEVVLAIDINEVANKVYEYNFPGTNLKTKNIQSLTAEEINKLAPEIILMSPPCQPFTRIGSFKDLRDERSESLLYVISLLPYLVSIKYVLLENVKGFESSETCELLITTLKSNNFKYQEFLLSPHQFRICNSRLRYYMLAKRVDQLLFNDTKYVIKRDLPVVKVASSLSRIRDIVEFDQWDLNCTYVLRENTLERYFTVLDIVNLDSDRSCCFTKSYTRYFQGTGSVLSIQEPNICIESLKNSKDIKELQKLKLRTFTPIEVARLMCFPTKFKFPFDVSDKQKYRLLGNSINVYVVSQLINYLIIEL